MIQQIEKLKEIINQNSMGHLPLSYRVDLMKQIGNSVYTKLKKDFHTSDITGLRMLISCSNYAENIHEGAYKLKPNLFSASPVVMLACV